MQNTEVSFTTGVVIIILLVAIVVTSYLFFSGPNRQQPSVAPPAISKDAAGIKGKRGEKRIRP